MIEAKLVRMTRAQRDNYEAGKATGLAEVVAAYDSAPSPDEAPTFTNEQVDRGMRELYAQRFFRLQPRNDEGKARAVVRTILTAAFTDREAE